MTRFDTRTHTTEPPWLQHLIITTGRRLAGSRFLGGETIPEALAVAAAAGRGGASTAFLPLLAQPASEADAWNQAATVEELIRSAAAQRLDAQVVLDPDHFGWRLSPVVAGRLLADVCRAAMDCGGYVHLRVAATDGGLSAGPALFQHLHASFSCALGIAISTRLSGAEEVVRRVASLGANLLLVDEQSPAATQGEGLARTRRERALTRKLCLRLAVLHWEGGGYVAVCSRDTVLLQTLDDTAAEAGVPETRYEFLFKLGDRVRQQRAFLRAGRAVRVLIPFGADWQGYLSERLAEWPWDLDLSLWRPFG